MNRWDIERDDDAIREAYKFKTKQEYTRVLTSDVFRAQVEVFKNEIYENGLSFKMKARMIAEEALQHVQNIITDPSSSGVLKLAAIKQAASWGGLNIVPKAEEKDGNGVVINIDFGGAGGPAQMKDITPHATVAAPQVADYGD
ncbi:MAG: hypothetical protein K8953_14030 [Proteobacteria bacterium]|nr:hypothetical protein [Pseudomonadota bacterium]